MTVPLITLPRQLALRHFQSHKQGICIVPFIVVGHGSAAPLLHG